MAGAIRPPSPTRDLQETGPKRAKTSNETVEALPEPGAQPAHIPFPGLIHASAGIVTSPSKVEPKTLTSCPENVVELLEALNQDELDVDNRVAREMALKFYASRQIESIHALRQSLPSHLCPLYVPRYFALEEKGASFVTNLSPTLLSRYNSAEQMPLIRFLPLCSHLQKFYLKIRSQDDRYGYDIVDSLQKILHSLQDLEELDLTISVSNKIKNEDFTKSDLLEDSLLNLVQALIVENSKLKRIKIAYDGFGCSLYTASEQTLLPTFESQLVNIKKTFCNLFLKDFDQESLFMFIPRSKILIALEIFSRSKESKLSKQFTQDLKQLLPELQESLEPDEEIYVEEVKIKLLENKKLREVDLDNPEQIRQELDSDQPFPEVQEGLISIIYQICSSSQDD